MDDMRSFISMLPARSRRPGAWTNGLPALLLAAVAVLGGCASADPAGSTPDGAAKLGGQIGQAASAPLNDLNLVRAEIPPVLQAAQRNPYAPPADRACEPLGTEIRTLDAVLGADLDTPVTGSNPSLIERGTGALGDAAVGAIRGAAEGVVPFRGWVRRLSGADRYSKDVAAAIAAGTIRRAYLKGVGEAQGCTAPAAPRKPAAPA